MPILEERLQKIQSTKKTTLYLPVEIASAVQRMALKNRRSFNSEVIIALEKHIGRQREGV